MTKPWIAYKVLGAGVVNPTKGFKYALRSGADFMCVGMFDFQIKHDAQIVKGIFARGLIVQSKIATRMIQLSPIAVLAVLSDTRGHGPCVDPASRRREESCHIHAAVPFSPGPRASAFSVPTGGECVWAHVMRAQVRKACASIERVVW